MKKVAFLTLIALGSAATIVIAAPEHGHGHGRGAGIERLKAADTNGDGMISRAEAAALPRLAEHFDQVDANAETGAEAHDGADVPGDFRLIEGDPHAARLGEEAR